MNHICAIHPLFVLRVSFVFTDVRYVWRFAQNCTVQLQLMLLKIYIATSLLSEKSNEPSFVTQITKINLPHFAKSSTHSIRQKNEKPLFGTLRMRRQND